MKIKQLIENMRDELNRAESLLSWLYTQHPEVYKEVQDSELGDTLTQDIRDDLNRTEDLTARIDLAMLMASNVGDVAIPTIEQIYETESGIDLPYYEGFVDTETVYNLLDEWCRMNGVEQKEKRD